MAEDKQPDEREDGEIPSKAEDAEPDLTKKHELEHRWTLWFDNPSTKQSMLKYGQTLRAVYTFDTVEDFWCLYNNIRTPGQLQPSATFYLFKDNIEPKWEDPKNASGGCWVASAPKGEGGKSKLDGYWLNAVLACIGEQFIDGEEICGVAVNVRQKADRVELWTKTGSNESAQITIGKQLRTFLDIPDSVRVSYGVFSEKLSAGTKAKDRYTV